MPSINTPEPTYENLKLLSEVSQLLTLLDLDRVMQQVMGLMSSAVGATRVSLFLHDEQGIDWNHIFVARDLDPDQFVMVMRTVLDKGLAGWVIRNKQAAIVHDTQTDPRWHFFPDEANPPRSVLCVPFIYDEHVLAVMTLAHPEPDQFDEHHLRLTTIVANQAAVALRNAQLFNQVQTQQRQLEIVVRSIPDALIVVDDEGQIMLVNNTALQLLNTESGAAVIGKHLADFPDLHRVFSPAQRIIGKPSGDYWSFEAHAEKTQQDFLVTMSRWDNPANKTSGFVLVMHDITALRDLHRFKDEMLRVVSHNLRNPVSLITTASDMLQSDLQPLPEDSDIPQFLSIIKESTERMEQMLGDLLSTETSTWHNINPAELIDSVLKEFRPLAARRQQRLEAHLETDDLPLIFVDPMLIREAMANYVSNAVKYTGQGGHIVIHGYRQENRFYFEVEDNGVGIAEEYLAQLFEPYFRIEHPDTQSEDGYGVGLNLVRTIIERHKGEVWVTSQEGVGSRFGFWLPL